MIMEKKNMKDIGVIIIDFEKEVYMIDMEN